ncbi:DUF21 domain-containing protein At1g55930, chloroplastic-like [Rosa rugosa]|uniref:DUF21 domain-containing protein At1g55930, chloroplastic-like n=1 Tax=Rosa rugosa TaxID=74645 RepID=UPI002B410C70|nr:DUF21 domain-containing protein At1g55930, chloroplastic-like [Rosa rugosa]
MSKARVAVDINVLRRKDFRDYESFIVQWGKLVNNAYRLKLSHKGFCTSAAAKVSSSNGAQPSNVKLLNFSPLFYFSCGFRRFLGPRCEGVDLFANRARLRAVGKDSESSSGTNAVLGSSFDFVRVMVKCGVVLAAMVCGVLVYGSRRAFAVEGVVNASYGVVDKCILMFRNAWPKTLLVLQVFKEQGLILAALLGLSAFFSMAETSITTLWPWKNLLVYSVLSILEQLL